jgi:hypothetical protein
MRPSQVSESPGPYIFETTQEALRLNEGKVVLADETMI